MDSTFDPGDEDTCPSLLSFLSEAIARLGDMEA